jgi:hypothetical protein
MFVLAEDDHEETPQAGTCIVQVDDTNILRLTTHFRSCEVRTIHNTDLIPGLELLVHESISLGFLEVAIFNLQHEKTKISVAFGNNQG